MDYGGEEH